MKGQVLNNKQRTPLASSNRQLLFQLLHYALKMLTSASIWNSNGKALENAHFSLWFLCYRNREYKVQAWQPSFIFKKNNLWRKLLVTADRINCLKFSVLGCLTSWATVGQQETVTLCSSEKKELTIRLVEAASLHLYLARPSSTSRTGKLRWPRTASPHRPRWRQTRGTDRSDRSPGCPPEERRQAQTKKN